MENLHRTTFRFLITLTIICFCCGSGFASPDQAKVSELIQGLRSSNRFERDMVVNELIKIGSPALPQLIASLNDSDHQVQEFAAGILGNIEDKTAVPSLLKALQENPSRRYAVVWALGKIKDERAIPYIIEEFRHEEASVRKTAMRAIIIIGTPAIPYLLDKIDDPDVKMRSMVITLFGEMGVESAEERVIKALDDKDPTVVEAACRSLGHIGSTRSVNPLTLKVREASWRIRINAINSLGLIGDHTPVPLLEKTINDSRFIVREWSARALENITGNRYLYLNEKNEMVHPYNMYR